VFIPLFTNFTKATKRWIKLDFSSGGKEFSILTLIEPVYDIFVLGFWPKKQQFSVALPMP